MNNFVKLGVKTLKNLIKVKVLGRDEGVDFESGTDEANRERCLPVSREISSPYSSHRVDLRSPLPHTSASSCNTTHHSHPCFVVITLTYTKWCGENLVSGSPVAGTWSQPWNCCWCYARLRSSSMTACGENQMERDRGEGLCIGSIFTLQTITLMNTGSIMWNILMVQSIAALGRRSSTNCILSTTLLEFSSYNYPSKWNLFRQESGTFIKIDVTKV